MSLAEYASGAEPRSLPEHIRWYFRALADGADSRDIANEFGASLPERIASASEHELVAAHRELDTALLLSVPERRVKDVRRHVLRAQGRTPDPEADRKDDPGDLLHPWSGPLDTEGLCRSPYMVDPEHGLYHLSGPDGDVRTHVLRVVPFPVARLIDAEGREWVRLAWWPDGDPEREPVTADLRRSQAADPRSLVPMLADRGVDIDGRSGAAVSAWISSAIAETPGLPLHHLRERQGWVDGREPSLGFVLGSACIGGSAIYAGPEGLAAGYRESGTLGGWMGAVWSRLADHPLVCAAVYASLSAALVPMLGVSSYAIELAARSSKGKSTALYAAASVWGYPDGDLGQMMTWASSARGMAVHGASLVGLPLIADDAKDARSIEQVVSQVYAYAQPSRRVTSTADHRPDYQATMRGVMMLSTETPIADQVGGSEGAQARLVSICSAPWTIEGDAGAALVRAIGSAVRREYGTLGRAWASALVGLTPEQRAEMRADLDAAQADLASAGGIDGRIMMPVALIQVAAAWADRLVGLSLRQSAIEALRAEVSATRERTDLATRAAHALLEHYTRHRSRYRRSGGSQREPSQGWAGVVHATATGYGVCWAGSTLTEILGDTDKAARAAIRDGIGWACEQRTVNVGGSMRVYAVPIDYQIAYLGGDPRGASGDDEGYPAADTRLTYDPDNPF